ncbi:MAG: Na+/H+ antiporter subunit E [Alphaproteobacteria bacterium]|nr:Na+/H+ antiporter subunit E [Alphaproteobacteria bacterium]
MIQGLFLALALAVLWAVLAPASGAPLTAAMLIAGGISVVVVTALTARAGLLSGRAGAAVAVTLADAARAAGAAPMSALRVLARVVAGPAPRPALVIVQVRTAGQAHAARVAAALSRGADSYTIDGDDKTMLVHVLDEPATSPDALHAVAARFAARDAKRSGA